MADMYVVYSAACKLGSATGRTFLENGKIDCAEDIFKIEKIILTDLQQSQPEKQFTNLFLTWWSPLSPPRSAGE